MSSKEQRCVSKKISFQHNYKQNVRSVKDFGCSYGSNHEIESSKRPQIETDDQENENGRRIKRKYIK